MPSHATPYQTASEPILERSLVVIGVHTPEFEFEKDPKNVADAVKRLDIEYPVAIDSDNLTGRLYGNRCWPRQTLIDAGGKIRWEHSGEGDYNKMEEQIRTLLKEIGSRPRAENQPQKTIHEAQLTEPTTTTPEIYVGTLRSKGFGNG